MTLYLNSKIKVDNIKRHLHDMLESDFPLSSGGRALRKLLKVFEELEKNLDRADKAKSVESSKLFANLINSKIYQALPIMGFILRSTNVRNTFELLDPFQVISDKVLQSVSHVMISAEWDYIPFAYPQTLEDLRSFVLIGMPGSEVGNPLIVPLAGHELGHAVWRNRSIGGSVNTTLQYHCDALYDEEMKNFRRVFPEYKESDLVHRELLPESKSLSVDYANFQAEELFCDMFGYALFGESYLHAFAYILAPGDGRGPTARYPTYKTRVETLRRVATEEGVNLPTLADLSLADDPHRGSAQARFIINMAERSVEKVKIGLWDTVQKLLTEKAVLRPVEGMAQKHLREIRMGIPAHEPRCLGDIINAGWLHYHDLKSSSRSSAELINKTAHLNEIVLKTIEVLEYRRRSGDGA